MILELLDVNRFITNRTVAALAVMLITLIIAYVINLELKTKLSILTRKLRIDDAQYTFFRKFIVILIFFIGIITAVSFIPELSALSFSLFASAGIVAIVIGLAAQQTLSNILSGITLVFSRSLRVGDKVRIRDEYGTVQDITLRHVVINSWDNRRVIIPNSKMGEATIINYTIYDASIIQKMDFLISYDSDIDKAKKIIEKEIREHREFLAKEKNTDLLKQELNIVVTEWKSSGIQISAYFWAKDYPTGKTMSFDLLEKIKKEFDKQGIEIPFNYTTVVFKKDLEEKKAHSEAK